MSNAIALATDLQAAGPQTTEWGEDLEHWKGMIFQQVQTTDPLPEIRVEVKNGVVTLTSANIPKELYPADNFSSLPATHEGSNKRLVFEVNGVHYQIAAQGAPNRRKRVAIDLEQLNGDVVPTPWTAEDCSGCGEGDPERT